MAIALMENDHLLRNQLVRLIRQGNAFTALPQLLDTVPYEITGQRVEGFSHAIWEIVEHIRIALHDLVEYSKDSYYQSPPWPDGFWPEQREARSIEAWNNSEQHINALWEEMIDMLNNPANDLFEPFAANSGHNLLRQGTIVAEHNAYHGGQIAMISKGIGRLQKQSG